MAFRLAELFVQLSITGADKLQAELDQTRARTEALNKALGDGSFAKFVREKKMLEAAEHFAQLRAQLGETGARFQLLQEKLTGVRGGFEAMANVIRGTVGVAVGTISGFVTAGMSGTAEANLLSFQMQM